MTTYQFILVMTCFIIGIWGCFELQFTNSKRKKIVGVLMLFNTMLFVGVLLMTFRMVNNNKVIPSRYEQVVIPSDTLYRKIK